MSKGYTIPAVLIVLLLILAGFFVSTPAQSPILRDASPSRIATTTPVIKEEPVEEVIDTATTSEEELEESGEPQEISTSTNSI
jgi:hypothetical protein